MNELYENSLSIKEQDFGSFIKNKDQVANYFFINFFGTLSLFMNNKNNTMRKYAKLETIVSSNITAEQINELTSDFLLSYKLADMTFNIDQSTKTKIERLINKILNKSIQDSSKISEELILSILTKCIFLKQHLAPKLKTKYLEIKTGNDQFINLSTFIFDLIKINANLKVLSKEFYKLYKTSYAEVKTDYTIYKTDVENYKSSNIKITDTNNIDDKKLQIIVPEYIGCYIYFNFIKGIKNDNLRSNELSKLKIYANDFLKMDFNFVSDNFDIKNEIKKLTKDQTKIIWALNNAGISTNYFYDSFCSNETTNIQKIESNRLELHRLLNLKTNKSRFVNSFTHSNNKYSFIDLYNVIMSSDADIKLLYSYSYEEHAADNVITKSRFQQNVIEHIDLETSTETISRYVFKHQSLNNLDPVSRLSKNINKVEFKTYIDKNGINLQQVFEKYTKLVYDQLKTLPNDSTEYKDLQKKHRIVFESLPSISKPPLLSDNYTIFKSKLLNLWSGTDHTSAHYILYNAFQNFGANTKDMKFYQGTFSHELNTDPLKDFYLNIDYSDHLNKLYFESNEYFVQQGYDLDDYITLYRVVALDNVKGYTPAPVESWSGDFKTILKYSKTIQNRLESKNITNKEVIILKIAARYRDLLGCAKQFETENFFVDERSIGVKDEYIVLGGSLYTSPVYMIRNLSSFETIDTFENYLNIKNLSIINEDSNKFKYYLANKNLILGCYPQQL